MNVSMVDIFGEFDVSKVSTAKLDLYLFIHLVSLFFLIFDF